MTLDEAFEVWFNGRWGGLDLRDMGDTQAIKAAVRDVARTGYVAATSRAAEIVEGGRKDEKLCSVFSMWTVREAQGVFNCELESLAEAIRGGT